MTLLIPRRGFIGLAIGSSLLGFASGVRGGPPETPKLEPGLFIFNQDFAHLCEVREVGGLLVFDNSENKTWGRFSGPKRRVEV